MKVFVLLSTLLALSAARPAEEEAEDVGLRAPSNVVICDCQCDPYTWVDQAGITQGNCVSPDKTGGRWCYTTSRACQDTQFSKNRVDQRGHKRSWSYQACSTPPIGSPQCRGGGPGFPQGGGPGNFNGGQPPIGGSGNINLVTLLGTRDATNAGAEAKPAETPAADSSVSFEQ